MRLESFDVETRGLEEGYGLQPFRALTDKAWLTMCAMANDDGVTGKMFNEPDPLARRVATVAHLKQWLDRCARENITVVAWNSAFDAAWLIALGLREEVYKVNWLDGMLLWKHLTNSPEWAAVAVRSYSLKAAVRLFMPEEAGYEADINFDTDNPVERALLFDYNKKDALFTLRLTKFFLSKMNETMRRNAIIEAACIPMVAESYVEGVCINVEAAKALEEKLTDDASLAFVKLKLSCDTDVTPDVIASPKKLAKLLYEDWGLKVPKLTDTGAPSTDRDALSTLALTDPRAELLNAYREAKNNCTKFATGAINSVEYNGDGRSRPSARIFGTYTGRMTYSASILKGKAKKPTGIPLHQWKRSPEFRALIEPPEGYTLLEFDFSGQEFRWMAVLSGDTTMLHMCADGEDAHAYMGAKVQNIGYDQIRKQLEAKEPKAKDARQLGKVANLSLQYRTSAKTLVRVARVGYNLKLSDQEAYAIHATYKTTYPYVTVYWKSKAKVMSDRGWTDTVAGRRIHVGAIETWKKFGADGELIDNTWSCESTGINFPIQGSGADQKYLALAVLRKYLPKVGGRFYFELHDGIFIIVPDAHVKKALHDVRHLLSNLPYKKAWGVEMPISFPVDAKFGKSWGTLEEVK
jgi:hypothetical protein